MFIKLCCILLFIKFIVCDFSILGVAAFNAQQRTEVNNLKSVGTVNRNVASNGVIVQPFWTQGADKSVNTDSAKVEVNAKNRNEVAALRSEIEKAVSKDSYAIPGAAKIEDIKALEVVLKTKEKGKASLITMATSEQSKGETLEEENVGTGSAGTEDQEEKVKAANIINPNMDYVSEMDIEKLQLLQVSKRRTHEILILKYIEEDFSFKFGADVSEWKHIMHAGQEYFIGRRLNDLLIVRKETVKYEPAMMLDVGHIINYMETYSYWNLEQQQQEGVVLIAAADKIFWYRANPETNQIELYWEWMLGNTITGLTHFDLDSQNFLTISSNQSFLAGHYALNIYQFKLDTKEFWIAQRLQLQFPCEQVTVLDSGRDVILAIPQNNTADIYTYNPHEAEYSHIHFEIKKSIAAEGISTVAGFKMGGHSYLALTGFQPQILLYQQGDFVSKTILGNNFGLVELFFPIPVKTYRDDLLLLVQHRVDFDTHTLTVVETLIWDGDNFEISIPVPCHLGEHVVYGVGCMLDLQRSEGLKGAALFKSGNDISIVVPRYNAESGLFRFHTELLAKNSELLDLQEIFDFLKDWVHEQDELIAQAEAFLQIPNEEIVKQQPDLTNIESFKTPKFTFNGDVGDIYVNDYKWTSEDSNIDLELLIQNIEDLEKVLSSGRRRRNLDDVLLHEELEFDELIVEDLELQKVNGETFFIQNGELDFEGIANFSQLEVYDMLSDLRKRQVINEENLTLKGDIIFGKINGVDWSKIKYNLIFKTQKQKLTDLEVKGTVFLENLLTINTLNDLNFPDDFLLSSGPSFSTVKAEKHFINTLSAKAVDTNGDVNGKNPMKAITLTDAQEWRGFATFKNLEVLEMLKFHGQDQVFDEESFPKNPTLQESNVIEATCHFNELVVNGPIILRGQMDGKPLSSRLKDIILRPENISEEILVPSRKFFDLVKFPIDFHIENNNINEIPVQNFVTVHTEQTLNIKTLEGYFYFHNLSLNGSYDGVKIENVLEEIILLDKPIDLSTTELIFQQEIQAPSVAILDTVNNETIGENLQTLQEDLHINTAEFESLQAQQADFLHDILGQGKLNNVELHSLVNERSWYDPPIKGNIFLNELILDKGVQTDELHGIKADFLMEFLQQIDELPDVVLNGQIQLDHIIVTGDVQLNKLNGLLFEEELQLTTIKLNYPNFLSTNLNFKNRLDIRGNLNIVGDFRGNYLPDLIDDIIIRTSTGCIDIKGPKSFLNPVEVLLNTQVKALNGIAMDNIAWKSKHNHFNGSVHIKGNLWVHDINLQGTINNFMWKDVDNLLYYDENMQNFVLKNTIEFKTPLFLEDLTVMGDLNDVKNLTEFFDNLIYKNQLSRVLKGKTTFTGHVIIDQGAYIKNLNNQDLANFLNNLVFIHGHEPVVIKTPVKFEDSVYANEMIVRKILNVESVNGCSIKEWLTNSLRVDQDQYVPYTLRFAAGSLDDNSLYVHFVNDKDLSRIITLNTPQTFNETIKISNVILSNGIISSKGRINNLNLEEEFNNTLMTCGHQHMSTPLSIQSVIVLGNLEVNGPVNKNKDLKDVATLQEDLIFESPLYFQSVYSPQIIANHLVNGIDFNKWFESAVKNEFLTNQYITGNWSTKHLTVRIGPKDLQHMINGFEPLQDYSYIRSARSDNKALAEDEEICLLVKNISQVLTKKPAFVKYLKKDFNIDLEKQWELSNETFNQMFYLKSTEQQLLLINRECKSFIFKWLVDENKFVLQNSFVSGPIDQVVVIPVVLNTTTKLQFITYLTATEKLNCSLISKTVNKWKVENDEIVLADDNFLQASDFLYKSHGNTSSLWTLNNETIQELDLDFKIKEEWQLPAEQNTTHYRFVPLAEEQEILLTNGDNMILLSKYLTRKFRKSSFKYQDIHIYPIAYFENQKDNNSQSILKPNTSLTSSFVFADFKQIIERILIDLRQRLNQQVNITQLSIPESDLFDEDLVSDFLAIMYELQKQQIYPKRILNISFDQILLPENPSQVLAARVVQISWPVVEEIEKIHTYLRSNERHDHPLCSKITKSLGLLIKDVLILANPQNDSKDDKDATLKLTAVIERIRVFEKDLENFTKALENYNDYEDVIKDLEEKQHEESFRKRELKSYSEYENGLVIVNNSHLPGFKQGEILSLVVGSISSPRSLWAVTNTNITLTDHNNNPGIYLYLNGLKGQLYQIISAIQPRSLQQLRIKQETLLLFIHHCCQVKILKYRGLQGFTAFAEIDIKEHIKQILTISLPTNQGNFKHFLILLLEKNIKFYEFVIEGYDTSAAADTAASSSLIPSDCL